jgi:hypothetical protein
MIKTLNRYHLGLLGILFSIPATGKTPGSSSVSLEPRKYPIAIHFNIPTAWDGPAHTTWPTYESWSFADKAGAAPSYFEIRVKSVESNDFDFNRATAQDIKRTFRDFSSPRVENIASVMIGGNRIFVWAIYNVDGDLLTSEIRRGKARILFSLRIEDRKELGRVKGEFVRILESLQLNERGQKGK